MPTTIGVVTSGDGAVWHDIQQVLRRRFPLVHLILVPTAVQGDHAPGQIVAALQALQADGRAEVIIVARGGGSSEDLWCFNDERVVRAVFACRVPVVSGVGHETDWTLIDDVADLRAPTPSAAAELCSPSLIDIAERLVDAQRFADRLMAERLDATRRQLDRFQSTLDHHTPTKTFQLKRARIGQQREQMIRNREQRLARERASVTHCASQLETRLRDQINSRRSKLELEQARLDVLDPRSVLRRGFAFVTSGTTGRPVHHISDVSRGSPLTIQLRDGVIAGTVDGIAPGSIAYSGSRDGTA
jgi:exodeoxyribonuclease VII large subunit